MLDKVDAQSKSCSRCKQIKPLEDFNKNKKHLDGLRCECKQCQKKQTIIDSEKRRARVRYYKFKSIYNGLTVAQKKIYEATPIAESWDAIKIKMEIARTRTPIETRIILGCLSGLVACGLVKEHPKGMFQRVPVDAKQAALIEESAENSEGENEQEEGQMAETKQTKTEALDPIERIGRLTAKCQNILVLVKELASDIETVAIEVQETFSCRDVEVAKLKQLQQLLKSLG